MTINILIGKIYIKAKTNPFSHKFELTICLHKKGYYRFRKRMRTLKRKRKGLK